MAFLSDTKRHLKDTTLHVVQSPTPPNVIEGAIYYNTVDQKTYRGINGSWVEITNGAPGADGVDGTNGTNGTNGIDGVDGADGANGADGATGASITSGAFVANDLVFTKDDANTVTLVDAKVDLKGEAGLDGSNGADGTNGVDGTNGIDGDDGLPGNNSKSFVISNPTANSDFPIWRSPVGVTITAVHLLCKGEIIVGQLWEYDANGLNGATVDDSDITGVIDTNVDDDGTLSNAGITAGNYVGWKTTSATAGATMAIISFEYTIT